MSSKREGRFRILPDRLPQGGEPGLGVFPRVEVAVELVGAKGAVVVSQSDIARAERGQPVRGRSQCQVAIVAVGTKAARKVTGKRELLGHTAAHQRERPTLLVDAEISSRGSEAE